MAVCELQQLAWRPLAERLLRQVPIRILSVVVKPAAHGCELPEGDLLSTRYARHVALDWIVKVKLALVCQQEDGCDREGLGGAADAHVEIGCHRLGVRHTAQSEGPHVGRAAILPDTNDGPGNRSLLHCRKDCGVKRGVSLTCGHAPCREK